MGTALELFFILIFFSTFFVLYFFVQIFNTLYALYGLLILIALLFAYFSGLWVLCTDRGPRAREADDDGRHAVLDVTRGYQAEWI